MIWLKDEQYFSYIQVQNTFSSLTGTTYPSRPTEFTPGVLCRSCYSIFSFPCRVCSSSFVLLLFELSAFLWFTTSDYVVGIFNTFHTNTSIKSLRYKGGIGMGLWTGAFIATSKTRISGYDWNYMPCNGLPTISSSKLL